MLAGMGCAHLPVMEHRRQAIDLVGLIVQFAGFIVVISLFFPAVRRVLAGLGLLAVCLSIFVIMGLIGFSVYRLATRQGKPAVENPFAPPIEVADQAGNSDRTGNAGESEARNDKESETAPDALEPAFRRRYPWRRETADHL